MKKLRALFTLLGVFTPDLACHGILHKVRSTLYRHRKLLGAAAVVGTGVYVYHKRNKHIQKPPQPVQQQKPTISFEQFQQLHTQFMNVQKTELAETEQKRATQKKWLNDPVIISEQFQPFIEKITVQPGKRLFNFGDLHGDIDAVERAIEQLQAQGVLDKNDTLAPGNHIVFAGDFVDRGPASLRVVCRLMELKIKNPQHVHLVRGNHEDPEINEEHGFFEELKRTYPEHHEVVKQQMQLLYNTLPTLLLVCAHNQEGLIHAMHISHGFIDIGLELHAILQSNARYQAFTTLYGSLQLMRLQKHNKRAKEYYFENNEQKGRVNEHLAAHKTVDRPTQSGHLWNDVAAHGTHTAYTDVSQRGGLSIGERLTQDFFAGHTTKQYRLRYGLRAHQHNDSMPGVYQNVRNAGLYKWPSNPPILTVISSAAAAGTTTVCFVEIIPTAGDWGLRHHVYTPESSWQIRGTDSSTIDNWQNNHDPLQPQEQKA